MSRVRMQIAHHDGCWLIYLNGRVAAKCHHNYLAIRRDYLVLCIDGVYQRLIVELVDCTLMNRRKLIDTFIDLLRHREINVEEYAYHQNCKFSVDVDYVSLVSKDRAIYHSRKPLQEFHFVSPADKRQTRLGAMCELTRQLQHDYRQWLLLTGDMRIGHSRMNQNARGYSFQHHSLYLHSLHRDNQVIAKLYDSTPDYSHLHGVIVGQFMRRPFAYAVIYRDIPEHMLVNRVMKTIEHHFGTQVSRRNLQVTYIPIKGEVTEAGAVLLRTRNGRVMAVADTGYYQTRRRMRDDLHLVGEYHGLHLNNYPHLRRICADHMAAIVQTERLAMMAEEGEVVDSPTAMQCGGIHLRALGIFEEKQDDQPTVDDIDTPPRPTPTVLPSEPDEPVRESVERTPTVSPNAMRARRSAMLIFGWGCR